MFKPANKIHFFYFCFDLLIIALSFFIPYFLRFSFYILNGLIFPDGKEYLFIFILWGILIVTSFQAKGLYSTDRALSIPKEFFGVLSSIITSSVIVATLIFFTHSIFFSRIVFALSLLLLMFFLSSWRTVKRLILRYMIERGFHNYNVLIVGTDNLSELVINEIRRWPFLGLKVAGAIEVTGENNIVDVPVLGNIQTFEEACKRYFIDEVIIATPFQGKLISEIGSVTEKMNLSLMILAPNFKEAQTSIDITYLGSIPLLTYKERKIYASESALKIIFDFFTALGLILLFFPLFFVIAILIKLEGGGAVFYVQKRTGRQGKVFNLYKFRSMVKDADKLKGGLIKRNEVSDGVIFKIRDDPRITRLGAILRKYSLDEMPQLINVLKGDMSLVGPRPFPIDESKNLRYEYYSRLNIRPGITGLAQIKGRSDLTFNHWVKWDLWYINNWSFGLDLNILLRTIIAVLKGKGAY